MNYGSINSLCTSMVVFNVFLVYWNKSKKNKYNALITVYGFMMLLFVILGISYIFITISEAQLFSLVPFIGNLIMNFICSVLDIFFMERISNLWS